MEGSRIWREKTCYVLFEISLLHYKPYSLYHSGEVSVSRVHNYTPSDTFKCSSEKKGEKEKQTYDEANKIYIQHIRKVKTVSYA